MGGFVKAKMNCKCCFDHFYLYDLCERLVLSQHEEQFNFTANATKTNLCIRLSFVINYLLKQSRGSQNSVARPDNRMTNQSRCNDREDDKSDTNIKAQHRPQSLKPLQVNNAVFVLSSTVSCSDNAVDFQSHNQP